MRVLLLSLASLIVLPALAQAPAPQRYLVEREIPGAASDIETDIRTLHACKIDE